KMKLLDWFGLITGVICVYLIVKENDWNWLIGIVNSVILIFVFLKSNLYAQVGLQALYVVEGFFGWYKWLQRDKATKEKVVKINKITFKNIILCLIIEIVGVAVLYYVFQNTKDPAPFIDSLITVSSIVAELMLCWKLYESWLVYLVTDFVSIGLLISQGMYITMGTYLALSALCVMGLYQWYKSLPKKEGVKSCV
ncbi:MAG: nicotinamide riboside transporter PnuC, partial [Bacillota bacterium]|nr:nicotinamide riboside transporter PnuC [Bacillota bacterium]